VPAKQQTELSYDYLQLTVYNEICSKRKAVISNSALQY